MRYFLASSILALVLAPFSVQAAAISLGSTTATISEFTGEAASDQAGTSVASAGDVNGDGYDDLLVGAFSNDDAGDTAGAAYLIYGQSTALTSASLSTIVEFTGEAAGDRAGTSVASAGDVNNDGYVDLLIGAYRNDDTGSNAGAAYLIYGQATTLTSASLSTAIEFTGEVASDQAGISVASAGDVNNDGYADFLVGSYTNSDAGSGAGAAYLIYGQAATLSSASLSTAVEFTGETAGDSAGDSVASAGDVNGDGYDDLLIGAAGNDDAGLGAGAAYLIYGQSTALTSASLSTVVEFTGEAASESAGAAVASAGDVNNDGYDDLLIGARFNSDAASGAGAAYLIYGQATTLTSASLSTAIEFTGEAVDDEAAFSVASAGDVNNDGYADFLVGSYTNSDAGSGAGAAYLIYGQAATLSSASLSTVVEFTGETAGDRAGYSVASAGDVNGDGYVDLLIGATGNDDAASGAGAVYLVYAQPSTVTITTNTTAANTIECATSTFTDPGATATDQYTNTSLTVATTDTVANTPVGTDTATYTTVSNTLHITGSGTRTVTVADTVAPVLNLVGDAAVTIQQDAVYSDDGVTVTEACDTTLTAMTAGTVDTSIPGDYTLTYSATDASGNVATEVSRIVTIAPHGSIATATKNAGNIDLVYADDYTQSIEPFSGSKQFVFAISSDELSVVATNGKLVRVFVDGEKVTQKKINKKTLRSKFLTLKVKQLYTSKNYDDVMVMLANKTTGKVNHLRLTATDSLTKFKHKQVDITDRQPGSIEVKVSKHRFTTQFGSGADKTKSIWKVTSSGNLRAIVQ